MSTQLPGAQRHRWQRLLLGDGIEPDPRFTLANERTFLAWLRTALAMMGGGLAVEALSRVGAVPLGTRWLGVSLIAVAAALSLAAAARWLNVERAMRQQRPLPLPAWLPILAVLSFGGACALAGLLA